MMQAARNVGEAMVKKHDKSKGTNSIRPERIKLSREKSLKRNARVPEAKGEIHCRHSRPRLLSCDVRRPLEKISGPHDITP
jgi:hypothetical protein